MPIISHWLSDTRGKGSFRSCKFEGENELRNLFKVSSDVTYFVYYVL